MSWKWLIDARGDKVEVDWSRLAIVLIISEILLTPLVWFAFRHSIVLGVIGSIVVFAGLIALDVAIRRKHPDNP